MVKPFLLKCHPDTQQMESAKTTNLLAIQNLNAYIDTVQNLLSSTTTTNPVRVDHNRVFEIDFVVSFSQENHHPVSTMLLKKKKKNNAATAAMGTTSRRKVELALPPADLCRTVAATSTMTNSNNNNNRPIERFAANQLSRLLKMAGLDVPPGSEYSYGDDDDNDDAFDPVQSAWERALGLDDMDERPQTDYGRVRFEPRRQHQQQQERSEYDKNRDRFTNSINWTRYDELYKKAMTDLEADIATEGMIAENPARRQT